MDVFASPGFDSHETVSFVHDRTSGLRAIVAIHDTTLGPAIGGCRMWPYLCEADAVSDVLRLSRAMTFKAALAGLGFGGGKTVIMGDPRTGKSEALFRALGRAIEGLGGRYYAGEDVGTSPSDMDQAGQETAYVLGRSRGGSGDPAPMTAHGVWLGIKAAVRHKLGRPDLEGLRVAIQGLGRVGYQLASLLHRSGAKLVVADLDPVRAQRVADEFGATVVEAGEILGVETEVLAPCALGGVIDDASLPGLACAVIAGSANNQLAEDRHGAALHARGILYVPDYVINAGGLINIAQELQPDGYDRARALIQLEAIGLTLAELFERAAREQVPPYQLAERIARERLVIGQRMRHLQVRPVPRRGAMPQPAGCA